LQGIEPFQGSLHLLDLVGLCRFSVFLQIDARISLPRSFEYVVAASDTGFPEMLSADRNQIIEGNVFGISGELAFHGYMIAHVLSYGKLLYGRAYQGR
jgi:hypothetical protein